MRETWYDIIKRQGCEICPVTHARPLPEGQGHYGKRKLDDVWSCCECNLDDELDKICAQCKENVPEKSSVLTRDRMQNAIPFEDCSSRVYSEQEREDLVEYMILAAEMQWNCDVNYYEESNELERWWRIMRNRIVGCRVHRPSEPPRISRDRIEKVVPLQDDSGRSYSEWEREDIMRYMEWAAEIQQDCDRNHYEKTKRMFRI